MATNRRLRPRIMDNLTRFYLVVKELTFLRQQVVKRRQFEVTDQSSGGIDEIFAEPIYWSSDWISIRFFRQAAGFGARGASWTNRTWNIQTGQEVYLWKWFNPKWVEDNGIPTQHFLKRVDPGFGGICGGEWHLTLEPKGMYFEQRETGDGCSYSVLIPYSKLSPFLSSEGRLAVETLRGSR